ncbi:hypothetical protein ACLMPM_25655 [Yersinia enterocolitica]|uniref:hypothetical protein n=1 Tax=Yersinia enterocolitica TaxID=630 RepID=UPI00398D1DF3
MGNITWVNNPKQHYVLGLGEKKKGPWKLFDEYAKSSIRKRSIPAENFFADFTHIYPSSIYNPIIGSYFNKLTAADRLDIVGHGSKYGPIGMVYNGVDYPSGLPAVFLAKQLALYGVKEVGVIALHSCNLGSGGYLYELRRALIDIGIKFGYLRAPRGLLGASHIPFTGVRPVYSLKFWEPSLIVKGNLDVKYQGTKYN